MAVIQAQCPHWVHVGLQHVEVDSHRHNPNNGFNSCPSNEDQAAFERGSQGSVLGKITKNEEVMEPYLMGESAKEPDL